MDVASEVWSSRVRARHLWIVSGVVLLVLGAFVFPLLTLGDGQDNYGLWGHTAYGSLQSIPRLGMVVPLWSLFLLGAGVILLLVFGLSREPRRGLVWPLVLFSLLFFLQAADLVEIGITWRWTIRFLESEWYVMASWAAVPMLALVPIAEVLAERFYFRGREEGRGRHRQAAIKES